MGNRPSYECEELLELQCGIVARWQLRGQPSDLVLADSRLRSGRWRLLYRGVYAAYTGQSSRAGTLWAGVRRCGPTAALSHFSAAELDGIVDQRSGATHVTVPEAVRIRFASWEFSNGMPPIVVHRSPRIDAARHPARTPPRTRVEETVLDLTDVARDFELAFSWLSATCGRRLSTAGQISAAAKSRARLRWRTDVLESLAEISAGVMSNLERHYVRNVERRHRLPVAKRQVRSRSGTRSAYLDNLYEEFGLAVELDGLASHRAETRWQDIRRDNRFAADGVLTLRYNWADVTKRSCEVAAEIARVLAQHGWRGTLRQCPGCQAVHDDPGR